MKTFFDKIVKWLLKSNHYKHLVCGAVYGLIFMSLIMIACTNIWSAFYITFISACGLALSWEANDYRHGGPFDFEDASMTLSGSTLSSLFLVLIHYIIIGLI